MRFKQTHLILAVIAVVIVLGGVFLLGRNKELFGVQYASLKGCDVQDNHSLDNRVVFCLNGKGLGGAVIPRASCDYCIDDTCWNCVA